MAGVTFRIHFDNGVKIELQAANADEARKIAISKKIAPILKIKRCKESA